MIIVLLLIIANGLFAMSEISIVSARKARLQQEVLKGNKNAKVAIELADDPSKFLSTVQIGITLIGILAGTFGGASVAAQLEPYLAQLPVVGAYSESLSLGLVVTLITYLSLVIGELAPKQIGLNNPEAIAMRVASPMRQLSRLTSPLVKLLTFSTKLVVRLLGIKPNDGPPVTKEEIQMMVEQAAQFGLVEPVKEEIFEQVFQLGDRRVNELMTPRPDVVWLDIDDSKEMLAEKIANNGVSTPHSRYPVARGSMDNVLGMVMGRDLLAQALTTGTIDLQSIMHPPLFVPDGALVLSVLEKFKKAQAQVALVSDEHGTLLGLMTLNDLLETIVGDVPELGDEPDPTAIQRDDGSWLVDGRLSVDDFKQLFGMKKLPDEDANFYETMGGFALVYLGRVPTVGDRFEWDSWQFEVVDMDWRRVDKLLVTLKA